MPPSMDRLTEEEEEEEAPLEPAPSCGAINGERTYRPAGCARMCRERPWTCGADAEEDDADEDVEVLASFLWDWPSSAARAPENRGRRELAGAAVARVSVLSFGLATTEASRL